MGNVPYPIDLGFYERSSYRYGSSTDQIIIARVGIGGVSFTPSREGLMDTERTRKTVKSLKAEFTAAAKRAVQRDVDAATSPSEALSAFVTASEALPPKSRPKPGDLNFKGDTLPEFDEVFGATTLSNAGYKYSTGKRKPSLATSREESGSSATPTTTSRAGSERS